MIERQNKKKDIPKDKFNFVTYEKETNKRALCCYNGVDALPSFLLNVTKTKYFIDGKLTLPVKSCYNLLPGLFPELFILNDSRIQYQCDGHC